MIINVCNCISVYNLQKVKYQYILYSTVEFIDVKVKVVKCNEQNNVLVSINEKTRSTYKLNMLMVVL